MEVLNPELTVSSQLTTNCNVASTPAGDPDDSISCVFQYHGKEAVGWTAHVSESQPTDVLQASTDPNKVVVLEKGLTVTLRPSPQGNKLYLDGVITDSGDPDSPKTFNNYLFVTLPDSSKK